MTKHSAIRRVFFVLLLHETPLKPKKEKKYHILEKFLTTK